jgi:thiamine pyrophosphate-dependent acetolactate synthase large subunit-like protein
MLLGGRNRFREQITVVVLIFGANGDRISSAGELLPTPRTALGEEGVSIVACPVDYSENSVFTEVLGQHDATRLPRAPPGAVSHTPVTHR